MPDTFWGEEAWSDEEDNMAEDYMDQEAPLQDNNDDDYGDYGNTKQHPQGEGTMAGSTRGEGEERSPSPFSQEGESKNDSSYSSLPWYRRRKVLLIALLVLLLLAAGIATFVLMATGDGNDDEAAKNQSNNNNNSGSKNDVFADKTTVAPSSTTNTPTLTPSSSRTTGPPTTTNGTPSTTTAPPTVAGAPSVPPTSLPLLDTAVPTATAAPTGSLQPSSNHTFQPTVAPSDSSSTNTTLRTPTTEPVDDAPTVSPTATMTTAPTVFNISSFESWEPLGPTLQGNQSNEQFGSKVDLSYNGRILAVQDNGIYDPTSNAASSKVRVWQYHVDTDQWHVMGQSLPHKALGNLAVNDNGQTLLALCNKGSVQFYLYNETVGEWETLGSDIVEEEGEENVGDAIVALSANGKRAVTATSTFDSSSGENSGRARVFQWMESSLSWEQVGQDILGEVENDRFGTAVAISADGSIIAVAASLSNNGGYTQVAQAGYVKVFRNNQNDDAAPSSWDLMQSLHGREFNASFGLEVALSADGHTLAVRTREVVHVFQYGISASGFEAWIRLGQDLIPSELCDGWGGHLDLSSNGRILAVSVLGCQLCSDSDDCPVYDGSVAVYGFMEDKKEPKWEQLGNYLRLADDSPHSLSLSGSGRSVAIAALNKDTVLSGDIHQDAGSVAVYLAT